MRHLRPSTNSKLLLYHYCCCKMCNFAFIDFFFLLILSYIFIWQSFFSLILCLRSSLSAVYKPVLGPVTQVRGEPISCSFMLCCRDKVQHLHFYTQTLSIDIKTKAKCPECGWTCSTVLHLCLIKPGFEGIFVTFKPPQDFCRFRNKSIGKNRPLSPHISEQNVSAIWYHCTP